MPLHTDVLEINDLLVVNQRCLNHTIKTFVYTGLLESRYLVDSRNKRPMNKWKSLGIMDEEERQEFLGHTSSDSGHLSESTDSSSMDRKSPFGDEDFISHENMLHNISEMLKKLEEKHREIKRNESYDRIWSTDLDIWKHRTHYRINALKIIFGVQNDSYSQPVYRPNDYETDEIVRRVNSRYEALHATR